MPRLHPCYPTILCDKKAQVNGMEGDVADGAGRDPRGGKDDGVAAYLRAAILDGRLTPGQRLVEADLTPALGVGRGVLREAFRRLAAEGMVELAPNRGAQVRRLGRTEALELLEIRTELEAFAARRAAAQMADPRLRRTFTEATARIAADGAAAGGDYIAENREYHAALVAAAGNAQLTETHRRLQLSLILAQIRFALEPSDIAASRAEHKAIAETLLAGDAAAAEAAVRAHLDRAGEILRRAPADAFRPEANRK
jgi:DNA-binding GntR family transcriptional regulator